MSVDLVNPGGFLASVEERTGKSQVRGLVQVVNAELGKLVFYH